MSFYTAVGCGEGKGGYCNEIIDDHLYYIRAPVVELGPTAIIIMKRQNKDSSWSWEVSLWSLKLTDSVLLPQTILLLPTLTWRKYRYFCSCRQGVKEHHGDTCSHRPTVRPRKGSPVNPNKEMKTKIQRIRSPLRCPEFQSLLAGPRKGASSIENAVTWKLVDTSSKSTYTRSLMHSYTKSYLTFCYCFSYST